MCLRELSLVSLALSCGVLVLSRWTKKVNMVNQLVQYFVFELAETEK